MYILVRVYELWYPIYSYVKHALADSPMIDHPGVDIQALAIVLIDVLTRRHVNKLII